MYVNTRGINPLSANATRWSNILRQIVGNIRRIVWVYFNDYVGLALKGLIFDFSKMQI